MSSKSNVHEVIIYLYLFWCSGEEQRGSPWIRTLMALTHQQWWVCPFCMWLAYGIPDLFFTSGCFWLCQFFTPAAVALFLYAAKRHIQLSCISGSQPTAKCHAFKFPPSDFGCEQCIHYSWNWEFKLHLKLLLPVLPLLNAFSRHRSEAQVVNLPALCMTQMPIAIPLPLVSQ